MRLVLFALLFSVGLLLTSCAQSRIRKFETMLEPKVGSAKKMELDQLLGEPAFCKKASGTKTCEYRTPSARNDPVPAVHRKIPGMGPDVSAYEYYDVIQLHYDDFETLQDWTPIVINQ